MIYLNRSRGAVKSYFTTLTFDESFLFMMKNIILIEILFCVKTI